MRQLSDADVAILKEMLSGFFEEHLDPLHSNKESLTRSEASSFRGYFLLMLAISNGTRSSEHINLLVEWVRQATLVENESGRPNMYVIKVSRENILVYIKNKLDKNIGFHLHFHHLEHVRKLVLRLTLHVKLQSSTI